MNFFEFLKKFPTEEAVITHFIKVRYTVRVSCHHCGSIKVHQKKDRKKVFHCADCLNTFSIFKGTIFEKSDTDLRKWMYAIHLFLNGKKGISGYQLMREIGVTYKTAWRMLKQIRLAMGNAENQEFIDTVIEIDETYVGGKPRKGNQHDDDDPPKRGMRALAVGTRKGFTSRSSAMRSRIGTLHKLAVGLATEATSRRPSALAASDVYFSRPKLTRRVCFRSTSRAHNQGPDPSRSRAT